jgi:hypothetical protein
MNLVQRMVAENLQSITSQELAEASDIPHTDIRQWLVDHKRHFERQGIWQEMEGSIILNDRQAMLAFCMLPSLSSTSKAWELSDIAESLIVTSLKSRQNERLN